MLNKSKRAQVILSFFLEISAVSRHLSFNESKFQSSGAIITPFVFNLDWGTANKHW